MASKLPQKTLTLKQFILRGEVLRLYRDIIRSVYQIQDKGDRKQLLEWARHDFRKNKKEQDEEVIRMMLSQGKRTLQQFQQTICLSK